MPTVNLSRKSFLRAIAWFAGGCSTSLSTPETLGSGPAVPALAPVPTLPTTQAQPWPGLIPLPEHLQKWLSEPRIPILDSDDPVIHHFICALRTNQRVRFTYQAGSEPNQLRSVSPAAVFHLEGFPDRVYMSGYCHLRGANRTFRLDLIQGLEPDGASMLPVAQS